jgi:hypothetical protein
MSVVVAQPSGGGMSVHVATQGLRNGSRWFGDVTVVDLHRVADSQQAAIPSTQTVSGGFTLDIDFDAVARPSVTASLQAHPDERCRSSVDTTTAAVATCHGGLRVSISAVQTRNPDRLAMVARIRGAHPGSLWSNWTSWRSKPETGGSGGEYEASENGVVEVRITFVGGYLPNRTFSTTFDGPSGQHCSLQLGTHRLASKA